VLSTRLAHMQRKRRLHKLLITSAEGDEGKSVITANLAFSIARRPNERVLLIEADLRRPSASTLLTSSPLRGITEWLDFPDDRYGELIFLLKAGWMAAESDFNGRRWSPEGMHGYHPSDSHSDAIFLSNEKPIQPMRTIADVNYSIRGAGHTAKERVAQ
jgi:CobQ/CobB/MinD/ParA nucleotide binding domain